MTLIERAADVLGSIPEPRQQAATTEQAAPSPPDPIERAVSGESEQSSLVPNQKQKPESVRKDEPLPSSGRISRPLNVNLDKLHQQNIITPNGERSLVSENFRRIKRHILANIVKPNAPPGTNLVMITSALPGEGKTFCAINLAISIAMEMDRTVLLIDADVARPSVTSVLGIKSKDEKGLMDVLLDRGIDMASVLYKTDIEKLSVLPAGASHARATEMLASERMTTLLQEIAERYPDRVIIFDSPPLLVASEACALANRMGQILIVVEADRTTEAALKEALGRIEKTGVLGVLLNKGAETSAGYYGGYGYGYGYGRSE